MPQDIMNEGPGFKQRDRETTAVLNTVLPKVEPEKPVINSPKDKVNPKGAPYGSKPGEKRIDVSSMTKSLGTYHKGTNFVPKTGNYTLEKGEAVVPKEKNMAADWTKGITGGKKPKKEIREIRVRKSHDGKHIIEHHHHYPEHHPMEEHTAGDMSDLHSHMDDHAGTPNMGEAQGGDQMAQLTAAPSPMPEAAAPAGPAGA